MAGDRLLLHTHTGLGDHIICNGMVHAFAEVCDVVYVPYRKFFRESMQTLYEGFSNIELLEFPDIDITRNKHLLEDFANKNNCSMLSAADPEIQYTRLLRKLPNGQLDYANLAISSDRQMYEIVEVPFSARYTKCQIPQNTKNSKKLFDSLYKGRDYMLVHRYSSNKPDGYPINVAVSGNINNLDIIEIKEGATNNIFDYMDLIYNAKEIHVVPSSVGCLVDSVVDRTSARLFFHNIKACVETQVNCRWNNNRWGVIGYEVMY